MNKFYRLIGKNVKKISLGTALALTTVFSAPAMAGFYEKYQDMTVQQAMEACPRNVLAQAPKSKERGVLIVDFTEQPEVCAARFMKTVSSSRQVILAERQEEPWRKATVDAARDIQKETGKPVVVAYYKDVDPDDELATTSFWAWGHKRDSYRLQGTYGIDEDMVSRHDSKEVMVSRGLGVQGFKDETDQLIQEKREKLELFSKEKKSQP